MEDVDDVIKRWSRSALLRYPDHCAEQFEIEGEAADEKTSLLVNPAQLSNYSTVSNHSIWLE